MEWNDSIEDPQAEILRLNGLIQKDPKEARAYYELGVVYEYTRDSLKAIEFCQKAIALEADNPLYYAFLVFLYSAREPEPELALDAIAKLAELGPDESDYEIEVAIESLRVDEKAAHALFEKLIAEGKGRAAKNLQRWVWNP